MIVKRWDSAAGPLQLSTLRAELQREGLATAWWSEVPGARMQEHKTDQCVTIHALEGNLRLHLPSSTIDLQKGSIIALDHTVVHDVEALEESVFLLTLGWSKQPRGR